MMFIRRTLSIAKREFRSYFNSPIAYIVISVFLLLSGWFFFTPLFLVGRSSLRGFFSFTPVLFIVFIPAITMRLIAEEVKTGTLEWLTSMPLRDLEMVLGKFPCGAWIDCSRTCHHHSISDFCGNDRIA